jgi:hypothetical protein
MCIDQHWSASRWFGGRQFPKLHDYGCVRRSTGDYIRVPKHLPPHESLDYLASPLLYKGQILHCRNPRTRRSIGTEDGLSPHHVFKCKKIEPNFTVFSTVLINFIWNNKVGTLYGIVLSIFRVGNCLHLSRSSSARMLRKIPNLDYKDQPVLCFAVPVISAVSSLTP